MLKAAVVIKRKSGSNFHCFLILAEREGFEPPVPFSTSVFKTGAIDHSATSPDLFFNKNCGLFLFDDAKVWQKNITCKCFGEKIAKNAIFFCF